MEVCRDGGRENEMCDHGVGEGKDAALARSHGEDGHTGGSGEPVVKRGDEVPALQEQCQDDLPCFGLFGLFGGLGSQDRHSRGHQVSVFVQLSNGTSPQRTESALERGYMRYLRENVSHRKSEYNRARRRLDNVRVSNQCWLRAQLLGIKTWENKRVESLSGKYWWEKQRKAEKRVGKASRALRITRIGIRAEMEKRGAQSSGTARWCDGREWLEETRPASIAWRSKSVVKRASTRMCEGKTERCDLPLIA